MLELILIKDLLCIDRYNKYRHYIKLKEDDKDPKEKSYTFIKEILK